VEADALQVMKLQGNAAIAKLLSSVALLLCCRVVINGLVAKPELNGVYCGSMVYELVFTFA
jgi:hypothetical protein